MNLSTIKGALYGWAAATVAGGTVVYWNEPDAPRPPAPSVRLRLIGLPSLVGQDELRDVTGDANAFRILGPRSLTLSVTAYGDTAAQAASDLASSLSGPDAMATLHGGGLSSLSVSPLRDVSELMETKWEQRVNFDVELLATEDLTVTPGVIEHVEASGQIKSETGATAETVALTVDKSP